MSFASFYRNVLTQKPGQNVESRNQMVKNVPFTGGGAGPQPLCFSSETLFHFKHDQTKYSIKLALLCQAPTILGRQSIKRLPQRLYLLFHEQGW